MDLKILFLVSLIFVHCYTWKTYNARISITESEDDTKAWTIPYKIDKKKLSVGDSNPVKLFNLPVNEEECKIITFKLLPDYYAAYVNVPDNCRQMDFVQSLEEHGASYIFLNGQGSQNKYKLHPNGLEVPVFLLSKSQVGFVKSIESKFDNKINDPEGYNIDYVRIQVTFQSPMSKKNKANLKFFYSPSNIITYKYIKQLKKVYNNLRDHINFTPIVSVISLNIDDENCISNGLYCALDPDGEGGPLTGKDVIYESMRQICIFKKQPLAWFNYNSYFKDYCFSVFTETCSKKVIRKTDLQSKSIHSCVKRSFSGDPGNGKIHSKILDSQLDMIREEQPDHFPSLYINNIKYQGHPEYRFITSTICETLKEKPEICFSVEKELTYSHESGFWGKFLFYVYMIGISLILTAMVCICYQRRKYMSIMDVVVKKRIDKYMMMNSSQNETMELK